MSRFVMTTRLVVLFVGVIVPASSAFGQASFQGLGDLPGGDFHSTALGVSADGRVVVGYSDSAGGTEAFRWENGVMTGLGDLPGGTFRSVAVAVSADGAVVVGHASTEIPGVDPQVTRAFRWENGVMANLGVLPGSEYSEAEDVSADGTVVVGSVAYAVGWEAIRWEDGVMTGLGYLPGGSSSSTAYGVSADGSVVVGRGDGALGYEGFRWQDGVMTGLGHLPGSDFYSCAYGVSGDGLVVVGHSYSALGQEGFRWKGGEMASIGDTPGGRVHGHAFAASADGSVIVGHGESESGTEASVWDGANGMRSLRDVLLYDYILDVTGWQLTSAEDVSDDGRTIVGHGFNPDGYKEAYIVHLPPPLTILRSEPSDGAIDGRQDYSTSGMTRMGIDRVRLVFSTVVRHSVTGGTLDETSFEVLSTDGDPPSILAVNLVEGTPTTYDIVFPDPIEPGTWTTIIAHVARTDELPDEELHDRVTIGFLPGDANGDGTSAPSDILRLIDNLNGVYDPPMDPWQCDIDRSGVCGPPDILRLIDLLNGANTSRAWLNVPLPPRVRARETTVPHGFDEYDPVHRGGQ